MKSHGSHISPMPGDDPGAPLIAQLSPFLRHCGDTRRPAWRIAERRLLDYLVVCIADGHGRFVIEGKAYEALAGDVFWIPPDTLHAMEGFPPGMSCPYVHFDLVYRPAISHWDFSIPAGMCNLSELQPLMHPPLNHPDLVALCGRLRGPGNRRVLELVRDICAEAARGRVYGTLRMSGLLLEMVAELLADVQGGGDLQAEHRPLLEEVERVMAQRCHEDLRMADLAGICRLSVSRFRAVFQQHIGRSPREHLRRLRIRRAQQLMLGSDLTLGEVAQRCGFATVHSFSRAFRDALGCAPSAWRRYGSTAVRVEGRRTPYVGAGISRPWRDEDEP